MKRLADYHVHSEFSADSSEPMENAADAALRCGLTEIAFTDHYDEAYPCEPFPKPDYSRYFAALESVQGAFPELTVRSGVELGMMRSELDAIRETLSPWDFDFVLFSKHVINGRDPWYPDYFADRTLREAEREYLSEMIQDIRAFDDFDVVGHIGYVDKYLDRMSDLPAYSRPFEYQDFPDELDELMREIISRGKGIEVNTSCFGSWNDGMPRMSVFRRYIELGGEIVTLGSDAHEAGDVGRYFKEALPFLEAAGCRWICTFAERQPQFHRLGS